MRQLVRISGALLLGAGVLGLAWALLVWQWQDPITALYTTYQQHRLAASYNETFDAYKAPVLPAVHKTVDLKAEHSGADQKGAADADELPHRSPYAW